MSVATAACSNSQSLSHLMTKLALKDETYAKLKGSKAKENSKAGLNEKVGQVAANNAAVAGAAAGAAAAALPAAGVSTAAAAPAAAAKKKKKGPKFKVSLLPDTEQNLKEYAATAKAWQDKSSLMRHSERGKAGGLLEASRNINKLIKECLMYPLLCKAIYDRIYICRNRAQSFRGIALTKDFDLLRQADNKSLGKFIKISHMATHPDNLVCTANTANKVQSERGTGTALISNLAKFCLRDKREGLYVESTEDAEEFYTKLGFEKIEVTVVVTEMICIPMWLTVQRIRDLAQKKVVPYCSFADDFK